MPRTIQVVIRLILTRMSIDEEKNWRENSFSLNIFHPETALSESMLTCPNSSLFSKFNPRNIIHMPVVKFIERLYLVQNISFQDGNLIVRA